MRRPYQASMRGVVTRYRNTYRLSGADGRLATVSAERNALPLRIGTMPFPSFSRRDAAARFCQLAFRLACSSRSVANAFTGSLLSIDMVRLLLFHAKRFATSHLRRSPPHRAPGHRHDLAHAQAGFRFEFPI